MRETTGAEERTQDQSTTATRTARKPRAAAKTRTKTSAKASGAMPPTAIAAKEPNLFGRITILDVRPDAQDAVFPARVELGEPFTVSAQVFLEGRATVRATAVLKNPRGRVMARVAMRETTGAEERTQDQSTTATRTARKPRAAAKTRTKTSAKASGAMPPTAIAAKEPNLFGRITILDVRPDAQDAVFPARVELGEPFTVSAQVFLEGRATVRATAVLKNPRGRVMARVPMTQTNTGLDTWTAMLQAGSPTDLTPWDEGFADMLGQLGNWKVAIEGWADTYTDWVLDATARVNADAASADAEGAIVRGSEILTRRAAPRDAGLDAAQRKVLRETAKQMLDATIPTTERLAIAQIDEIAALHTTNPHHHPRCAPRRAGRRVARPRGARRTVPRERAGLPREPRHRARHRRVEEPARPRDGPRADDPDEHRARYLDRHVAGWFPYRPGSVG